MYLKKLELRLGWIPGTGIPGNGNRICLSRSRWLGKRDKTGIRYWLLYRFIWWFSNFIEFHGTLSQSFPQKPIESSACWCLNINMQKETIDCKKVKVNNIQYSFISNLIAMHPIKIGYTALVGYYIYLCSAVCSLSCSFHFLLVKIGHKK